MPESEAQKPFVRVAISVIFHEGKFLITQRKSDTVYGGYWEFPGGKIEPGETPQQAAVRENLEELDIQTRPVRAFSVIRYEYKHAHVELNPILCHYVSGEPKTIGCQAFKWIEHAKFANYTFPEANEPLIEEIRDLK